ncbi:MAG: tyrosine--tRNA ligase [Chthonomonadales bacterium]
MDIKDQVQLLLRGTAGVTPEDGLAQKLQEAADSGRPLNVKLGLDPTAPDIHLGFAVVLRKLRQFQDLGHQVILVIGDFTALIGDPSGRSATRPMLSPDQIQENARTYVDQLSLILDRNRTTVRFNSEWLAPLGFADVVRLCARVTVARILERADFAARLKDGAPVGLHELLYPLAQAYDSVAIHADVELGGTDQTFNILMGRDLQVQMGQSPQVALFMPLLVGLDGVQKMSKSLGNYVGISEPPDAMFGKIMSIPDELLEMYFELCTEVDMTEVRQMLRDAGEGRANPKDIKRRLAREIVAIYHGWEAAQAADDEFERIHARRELPAELPDVPVPDTAIRDGTVWICRLLAALGLAKGTGEARRLVAQGGVRLDGVRVEDANAEFGPDALDGKVLQVGNRHFVRLRLPSKS